MEPYRLDMYLFVAWAVIAFIVVIVTERGLVKTRKVGGRSESHETIRVLLDYWSLAAIGSFLGFFVGWFLNDSQPLGWVSVLNVAVFAIISLITVRHVLRLIRKHQQRPCRA